VRRAIVALRLSKRGKVVALYRSFVTLRVPQGDKRREEQKRSAACSFANYIYREISCRKAIAFTYILKCSDDVDIASAIAAEKRIKG